MVDWLGQSFQTAVIALIMPLRLLMFSIHNSLTKRDYSYSIDDYSDITVLLMLSVWIYTRYTWNTEPIPDPSAAALVSTEFDVYVMHVYDKHFKGEFNIMIFLAVLITAMWLRFILML